MKITNGRVRRRVWFHDGKRRESWGWSVEVDGKQFRRQGWDSRAEAQDELHRFKEELRNPKPVEAKPEARPEMTLAQAFEWYFRAKARKRSLDDDERLSKHLLEAFGKETLLSSITAGRIAEYKAQRLATKSTRGELLAPASVNRPLQLLRHLLRLAATEWEVIEAAPRIKLEREPEGRLRWLTPEEATRLLDACRASRNADLADLVELSLYTGLRRGEALGLTWERVDRARGVILIDVSKSGRRREVPLNESADAVLARRHRQDANGLVFGTDNFDHFRSAWEGAVERAKLADFRWHDLRHTYASWMVQRRASLLEVQHLLGHASGAMTRRYAHLAPEHLRAAAAALDSVLPRQSATGAQEPAEELTASRK